MQRGYRVAALHAKEKGKFFSRVQQYSRKDNDVKKTPEDRKKKDDEIVAQPTLQIH